MTTIVDRSLALSWRVLLIVAAVIALTCRWNVLLGWICGGLISLGTFYGYKIIVSRMVGGNPAEGRRVFLAGKIPMFVLTLIVMAIIVKAFGGDFAFVLTFCIGVLLVHGVVLMEALREAVKGSVGSPEE